MPANRTSGTLLLQLTEAKIECDRLSLENELLRNQLRRHPAGEMQIREVERRLTELHSEHERADEEADDGV